MENRISGTDHARPQSKIELGGNEEPTLA